MRDIVIRGGMITVGSGTPITRDVAIEGETMGGSGKAAIWALKLGAETGSRPGRLVRAGS